MTRPVLLDALVLLGLQEAANELNFNAGDLLVAAGFSRNQLNNPSGFCSWLAVAEMLELGAAEYGLSELGLIIGKHQPSSRIGLTSQITQFCPDLRAAMERAVKYHPIYSEGVSMRVHENQQTVLIERNQHVKARYFPQIDVLGMVQFFKVCKAISEDLWHPSRITFRMMTPKRHVIDAFQSFFDTPVEFGAQQSTVSFPAELYSLPIPTADSDLLESIERHAQQLIETRGQATNITQQVRQMIQWQLGGRQCSIESIAQLMDIHPKALHRKLKVHNTTFKQLLNEERGRLAKHYLTDSNTKLATISDLLGYSDVSAFSRAFKAHSGLSPNQFRDQLNS